MENAVTKREKISYGLYFMGQNVFYGLVGYMTTYFTDIGITAALVAIVALITKVWDAINDPIFGMIMDKVNFKKGKFLPWLRISVIAIPVTSSAIMTACDSGESVESHDSRSTALRGSRFCEMLRRVKVSLTVFRVPSPR
jgi:Na+/melibiose symporter-like transporter